MIEPYTKELLEQLISDCSSYREMIKRTGRAASGGESYRLLKKKILEFGLDDSKIKESKITISDQYRGGPKRKYNKEDVFCKNSPVAQKVLRTYVERYKPLVYECAICGFDGEGWEGKISLELDHINGDNTDNRIENLRYLCPNCHANTSTYRGKNKRLKRLKETMRK